MGITINDVSARADYVATAGQTVFPLSFVCFDASDLKVYKNGSLLTLSTNYTVQNAGANSGLQITLTSGAAASDKIAVVREVPYSRTTELPSTGPFQIGALNTFLSKVVAMIQQLRDKDARALQIPTSDPGSVSTILPVASSRLGKVLAFNETTGSPEMGPTVASVESVAANAANVQTVGQNITNVNTVATNISAVNAAYSNATNAAASASAASSSQSAAASSASAAASSASSALASANAAGSSASTAAAQASTSTTKASESAASAALANDWATKTSGPVAGGEMSAKYHAQAAGVSETNAATSASNANTYKNAAQSAQAAAEAARDTTLAAYDNFDDRYLGPKASDPSVDNDGNALIAGSLYFNTALAVMKMWTGSAWVAAYVSGAGVLQTSGGTMTGSLVLAGNPSAALEAAPKQYIDASVTTINSNLSSINSTIAGLGSTYVAKSGSTMSGDLAMSGSAVFKSSAASENARATGYKIASGVDIGECDRSTQYYDDRIANCRGAGQNFNTTNCGNCNCGVLPTGNCSGNTSYNPPNGNWWTWGVTGVPTSNCSNVSQFDGAGGDTRTLYANTISYVYDAYYESANEIGGSEQHRNYNNCNCGNCNSSVSNSMTYGPFNCRTNCNCNCDCNCNCPC